MTGTDKAASPVFKVIDALACGRHGPGVRMCLADRLADLGIDPDMSVEKLRRRLACSCPIQTTAVYRDDPSEQDITECSWCHIATMNLRRATADPTAQATCVEHSKRDNTDSPA